jgi:serine/threonine-protein kinase
MTERGSSSGIDDTFVRAAPTDPTPEGAVVAGRFEIHRELARGGMGAVYVAHDRALERTVALKLILPVDEPGLLESLERRFEREIRILEQVRDQRILRPLAWGRDAKGLFFASDLLEGRTLAEWVAEEGPLSEARARFVAREVARALAEVHAAGFVHRDIKPANLFAERGRSGLENIWVLDFGIARALADDPASTPPITREGGLIGTPSHLAPEQAMGGPVSPATDIYALGVTLFELLTGSPPFRGEPSELVRAHAMEPAPRLRERAPGVSAALDDLVARMLAKDPDERPASATELLSALNAPPPPAVASAARAPGAFASRSRPRWAPSGSRCGAGRGRRRASTSRGEASASLSKTSGRAMCEATPAPIG